MDAASVIEPVMTLPGRIGWSVSYSEIIFADPPYLLMQSQPDFPGCYDKPMDRGIVWDVFALIESAKRPGAHGVLTSDCAYAPDSGLQERVLVSHPDADTVVWELDVPGLRPALDHAFSGYREGFLRLVFRRDEYEADIRAIVRQLQHGATTPITAGALPADCYGVEYLRQDYPHLDVVRVGDLEPNTQGMALERLLDLDAAAPWLREPLWPAGILVELGFFPFHDGHVLMRVNGELNRRIWPGRYFPRWQVLAAFKAWLAHAPRAGGLGSAVCLPPQVGINESVLLREADREPCHDAGRYLAAVLQACLDEGRTAPGVTVRYQECPLCVVAPDAVPGDGDTHV
jgi:hypothetical protein